MLRRLGNKKRIADKIQAFFPAHTTYIEFFFGAGGMFFNKPKAPYNIMNDNDSEVYNLYSLLKDNKEKLYNAIYEMPIHEDLWRHWKINKETEPLKKAVRFLFLSNFGYMGKPQTLRFGGGLSKQILLNEIKVCYDKIWDVEFMNVDFRKVINKISLRDDNYKNNGFIYADPPYLGTDNNYESDFKEQDSSDLFDELIKSDLKFAMSEFDNPFILEQAKSRNLHIETIGERVNMKNRRTEVLITNYETHPTLFGS